MSRIRSVHPGLFTDEAFVSVSPLARLLAIGLWTEADDQGVFEWKPITMKLRLLAVDNADVPALLSELSAANVIRRFAVDDRDYGAVRNFQRFQRPKKPNALHPLPPEFRTYVGSKGVGSEPDDDETPTSSPPPSAQPPPVPPLAEPIPDKAASVPRNGEIAPQMEEGGGREGWRRDTSLRSVSRARRADCDQAGFDEFWRRYPNRKGKGAAEKAWPKALQAAGSAEVIVFGLITQLHLPAFDMARDEGRFVPHPATWLNRKGWLDGREPEPANPAQLALAH